MKKKAVVVVIIVLILTLALFACKPEDESFSYTLTLNTNGGNAIAPIVYDGSSDIVLTQPQKQGYTFENWYLEQTFDTVFSNTTISGDTTIYAKWTLNNYTISYVPNNLTEISATQHGYNTAITAPQAPEKAGYVFLGWYLDEDFAQEFELSNMPAANITLYGKWTATYTIGYVLNGGDNNVLNPVQYTVESQEIALAAPTKANYDFKGWYAEDTFNTVVTAIQAGSTGNKTFYAKWDNQTVVTGGLTLRNDGEGEFEVIASTLTSGDVVILSEYGGMPVVKIGPQVFEGSGITGVTVPASVEEIGYRAFAGCTQLSTVNFAEEGALYQIDQQAFMDCIALEVVVLPSSLVLMGTSLFEGCETLVDVYVERKIDWQLDYMGTHGAPNMFDGCFALENIYVYRSNGTVPVWADNWEEIVAEYGAKDGVMEYKERNEWSNYASLIKANPNEVAPE
ncbi:MAG: InlB B-repeat-containing protein [Clostridia bacterium]|nr:InlB B-repeat-containing protein [Clostridia bacterium]